MDPKYLYIVPVVTPRGLVQLHLYQAPCGVYVQAGPGARSKPRADPEGEALLGKHIEGCAECRRLMEWEEF
ncbi:MAG TPA: hypothetical protein VGN26_03995 [Armatimonadota bacterium]|jgi:hypothetical protein